MFLIFVYWTTYSRCDISAQGYKNARADPRSEKAAVMAQHMLRKLEDLSLHQLAELSAEVATEYRRKITEVWGVPEPRVAEPTPEPAPHGIEAESNTRIVISCYVYLTADDQPWHCDRSCVELREHPKVQQKMAKSIVDAGNLYVANWLAELKPGPCSFCTPNMWEMIRRQHRIDPELQQPDQSSSSGSGNPSVSFGSSGLEF